MYVETKKWYRWINLQGSNGDADIEKRLMETLGSWGKEEGGMDGDSSMEIHTLLNRFSRVRPCETPEMAAHQAPPSMGFARHEYWSGLPLPSPCTTICKIDSQLEFALWLRELQPGLCDNLDGWDGMGGARDVQEAGDMCIPMVDSCWCMAETHTIL